MIACVNTTHATLLIIWAFWVAVAAHHAVRHWNDDIEEDEWPKGR